MVNFPTNAPEGKEELIDTIIEAYKLKWQLEDSDGSCDEMSTNRRPPDEVIIDVLFGLHREFLNNNELTNREINEIYFLVKEILKDEDIKNKENFTTIRLSWEEALKIAKKRMKKNNPDNILNKKIGSILSFHNEISALLH